MFWLLVLVSGNNIEYWQAVGKRCSEKVAILEKPALQILWIAAKIPENKLFLFHRHFSF